MLLEQLIHSWVLPLCSWIAECCVYCKCDKQSSSQDNENMNITSYSNIGNATSDSNDDNTTSNSNIRNATSDSNDDNTTSNSNIRNATSDSNDDNTTSNSNDENESLKFKICSILCSSVETTSCLLSFAVLITVICGQIVYLNQLTTERCVGTEHLLTNYSTTTSVLLSRLTGEVFIVFFLNLWYPFTMVLLLGWEKAHINNLIICVITSIIAVLYKVCLYIIVDGYITGWWKRLISTGVMLIGIIITCLCNTSYQASSKVNKIRNLRKNMLLTIGLIFCSATLFTFVYGELFVPWFNNQSSDVSKILVAAMVPLTGNIPVAISKYIVLVPLKNIIEVNPSRSYILVYFNHVVPIALYRVMQSDVKHFEYFILFSFLQGLIDNVTKLTRKYRSYLFERFLKCWKITPVPYCEKHNRRLEADIYIQEILFQFEMLILAQLYTIFYRMDTFQSYSFDGSSLLRLFVGLLMEFIFACLSIRILIWQEGIKIKNILKRHWTRHVLANGLITMTTVLYFSPIIINIYKFRFATADDVKDLRHCT
ncbi:uncharacterized protein LOC124454746 [Xenia sp. Carnegie-2017]|uniref:uncharacterized protein LOC124454746 n=1 Tax=Xenia sp. Carnegie-2017 TaxID=2897299 RepID=UPI001F0371C6|nr:uncharacterized protein LOC124454746 [Xenia sp. Carnegie-2017]